MKRPRALVLTYYYDPEPNFITRDVAETLAAYANVTVITTHPNFPSGRFYVGFHHWRPERRREGNVTVWRLPHVPDRSTSKLRRGLSYLSFAMAALLFAPFVAGRPRLVWVYHTPFTTALAALPFKYLFGSTLALTTVDLWPENFMAVGLMARGRAIEWLFRYRRWINRQADVHLCCSEGTARQYLSEGIAPSAIHVIPVWVAGIPDVLPTAVATDRRPTLVYAGTLGPSQPIDTMIRAAAQLQREGVDVWFDIYGSGGQEGELRALAASLSATNVSFRGRVSPEEAFNASSSALAQVITIRSTPLFRMVIPSKLYLAFAAGSPILAGLEGEAAEMSLASGGAIVFHSESTESLCAAIRQLLNLTADERAAMRERLRAYYETNYRRGHLLERYTHVLIDPLRGASRIK